MRYDPTQRLLEGTGSAKATREELLCDRDILSE